MILDKMLSFTSFFCWKTLSIGAGVIGAALLGLRVLSHFLEPKTVDYTHAHVVITGGSSGIGLEMAREYLRRGANVTIGSYPWLLR